MWRGFGLILLLILLFMTGVPDGHAATYRIQGDVVGQITHYKVKQGDTLYAIARAHDLGIVEVLAANPGVDTWIPKVGRILTLPTMHVLPKAPRQGIVINLSELRLYFYPDPDTVMTFPIGIGREGWPTPLGVTAVEKKRVAPVWIPPQSIRLNSPGLPKVVAAGPNNPLGSHALNLGWSGYVIHGTNRPYGVGQRSSHGCIRLYPEDIPVLFEQVAVGTRVTVIDDSYKLGWREKKLWLEVTPAQSQIDEILKFGVRKTHIPPTGIDAAVVDAAVEGTLLNWHAVDKAAKMRASLPVIVGQKK